MSRLRRDRLRASRARAKDKLGQYREEIDQNSIASGIYDRLANWLPPEEARALTMAADYLAPGVGAAITAEDGIDMLRDASSLKERAIGTGLLGLSALEVVPIAGKIAKPAARALKSVPTPRAVADFAVDMSGELPLPKMLQGKADLLDEALEVRAQQMKLKPKDRIQPRPDRVRMLDQDYATPTGVDYFGDMDLEARYPRNPDLSTGLPKKDRSRALVDRADEIAGYLAEDITASGQMNAPTRYFYHSDRPIYRAAREAGLSEDEAAQYMRDFSEHFAATSPRTEVDQNLLNTTLSMAKQEAGVPLREIRGPGTIDAKTGLPGISEKGYPMMTGKDIPGKADGMHGALLDRVWSGEGIDVRTNPKPSTFGLNMAGNRSGATIDTHAIRGTLMSLNKRDPGSVPDGFILPKFKAQYAADPTTLTPDMIDDSLAGQMIGPKGATEKLQTEYPVFADVWHKAADKLGVDPAEAQSMGWFGFGDETNLGSQRKTVADIFDERIDVTAQAMGMTPTEVARNIFRRKMPLLSTVPGAFALPMLQGEDDGAGRNNL